MARFRFSLEALLRLRETQEERERETLEGIAHQIRATEELLLQSKNERRQLRRNALRRLSAGIAAEQIQLDEMSHAALVGREQAIRKQIDGLRAAWQEQYQKFLEARKQSEMLRSLRNDQHAAFMLAQRRIEQQEADDLYNIRSGYNKL